MKRNLRPWFFAVAVRPGRCLVSKDRHFPAIEALATTDDEHRAVRDFARVLYDSTGGELWLSGRAGRRILIFFLPLPDGQKFEIALNYSPLRATRKGGG